MPTPAIDSVILEAPDAAAAESFYTTAFDLGDRLRVRTSQAPTTGFRGYVLSLVVAQPGNVDALFNAAVDSGATIIKPAKKSFWGYGGVLQAPDGAIWKIATSEKKDSKPVTRDIDSVVVLLGVEDVKATKQFYVEQGLGVAKSFGSKYVEFATGSSAIKLALYTRRAAAKDAGVTPEGTGARRFAISTSGPEFTDPDGLGWEGSHIHA